MLKLGFVVSALAVLAGVAAIVAKLTGHGLPGYASFIASASFLAGVQLLVLGAARPLPRI
jgi:hypothetical protein